MPAKATGQMVVECEHCHPHCVMPLHGPWCAHCACRKTLPLRRRSFKITIGAKYLLRQGRAVEGRRRVGSGEMVRILGDAPEGYVVETHDGIILSGIPRAEIGRYRG